MGRKTEQCVLRRVKTQLPVLLYSSGLNFVYTETATTTAFTPTEKVVHQGGSKYNRDSVKYSGFFVVSGEQRTP